MRSAACRRERPGTLRAYVWPLPSASLSACKPQRESKEKLNTGRKGEERRRNRKERRGEGGERRRGKQKERSQEGGRIRS